MGTSTRTPASFVPWKPTSAITLRRRKVDFALAYQYMMMGYHQDAKQELAVVTSLAPADKLAAALLKQL